MNQAFSRYCALGAGLLLLVHSASASDAFPKPQKEGKTSGSPQQRKSERLPHDQLLLFRDSTGQVQPVRSVDQWRQRRATILAGMQEVMGLLPLQKRSAPLEMKLLEEIDCGSYMRRLITYQSGPGEIVPAYLLVPKSSLSSTNQVPAVLCLHQTRPETHRLVVGMANSPNDEYAVDLVKRGYVCLAPPYPLLGDYHPDLKKLGYQSGTMKAAWDNIRGLDLLESLPFIRKGAFAAIGHSLGGHNSIFTSVFDERIKVVITSCAFDSFRDYMNGDIRGWTSERYMPKLLDYQLTDLPFDFHELIGSLAPRACFVSAPFYDHNFKWRSVYTVEQSASKVFELYGVRDHLQVRYPKCEHQFPIEVREAAYRFLEEHLSLER